MHPVVVVVVSFVVRSSMKKVIIMFVCCLCRFPLINYFEEKPPDHGGNVVRRCIP